MDNQNEIYFSVDAGIIDRLGRELVSRPETAVSELIKNCYDADAKLVEVEFINSQVLNGTLIIQDNGLGMDRTNLINGFMRLSSTDKVHNPYSERYKRLRAGRKGIGRFATQRLGSKLTIITQTLKSNEALELTIDWADYGIDQDLQKIKNTLNLVPKIKEEGTKIIIEGLKDIWDEAAIKKAYRHVSELIQPEYLSKNAQELNTATQKNGSFIIEINKTVEGVKEEIKDDLSIVFNKSLAVIEGYIDNVGDGFCGVASESLALNDYALPIPNKLPEAKEETIDRNENNQANQDQDAERSQKEDPNKFKFARNVHFKLYYFIYKKPEYYNGISRTELSAVEKIAKTAAGIKLFRNGFRVSPYGDPGDDWLRLDSSYVFQSGVQNIPLFNRNFFGFVEIIDRTGQTFEETASREGLLHNNAYHELEYFIRASIATIRNRIAEKVNIIKDQNKNPDGDKSIEEQLSELEEQLNSLEAEGKEADPKMKEKVSVLRASLYKIKEGTIGLVEELGMLRILSAMGLLIGEFSHELTQYTPSIRGYMNAISEQVRNGEDPAENLQSLNTLLSSLISYITYFKSSIKKNTARELKPINVLDTINSFVNIIVADFRKMSGEIIQEERSYGLHTTPMHTSEWNSILFNLYTNSKKAIKRAEVEGRIKIVIGKEGNHIFIEFNDNGDGIPEENKARVFNAFFSTSTPIGYDPLEDGIIPGNGLGLKIVKDILESYKGEILLKEPEHGYSTNFRINIPFATPNELNDYGL